VVATAGSGNRNGTAAAWIRSGVGGAVSAARAHSFSAHAFSDAPIVLGTRFRYRVNGPCTCRFPPHAWRKLFECVTRQLVWGKVRYAGKSLPERFKIGPLRLTALIPGAQNAQGDFERLYVAIDVFHDGPLNLVYVFSYDRRQPGQSRKIQGPLSTSVTFCKLTVTYPVRV
jgi:hypothetical protein